MADRLESLLEHFPVQASVLHAGTLTGSHVIPTQPGAGQLHLIRSGQVTVRHGSAKPLRIAVPSMLLYPASHAHRFTVSRGQHADVVCANVKFDGGSENPIVAALPPFVCLPLSQLRGCDALLALLFEEALDQRCGRRTVLEKLFELVLIQVLRNLMENGELKTGLISGLRHPRLRLAITAMHDQPQEQWSLQMLAAVASMSRSAFAQGFRSTVGCTPGEYLQRWRIALAQKALRSGRSLKFISDEVGYASESALSRAFKAQTGLSPREWKTARQAREVSQR